MWKHGLSKNSEPKLLQVRIYSAVYFSVSQNLEKTENVRFGGNSPPFRGSVSWNLSVPACFSAILAGEKTAGTGNFQPWGLITHHYDREKANWNSFEYYDVKLQELDLLFSNPIPSGLGWPAQKFKYPQASELMPRYHY